MRAWEIVGEQGIDGLELNTRACGEPQAGEVLVRVRASSLNYRDLATILNPATRVPAYPRIPNSDCAGEIVAVGPGVSRVAPGDRVAGCFFQNWTDGGISPAAMESALGGAIDGVLGEYAMLSEQGVVHMPEHLSFAQGACLPCAAVTAWNCLMHAGQVQADDTVLLLGTGGVSVIALQLAVAHGAKVIITSSDDSKLERARSLGAEHTINYRTHSEWDAAVLELTGGAGADFALEVGGGGTLPSTLNAVRIGGRIALIGVLTQGEIDPTTIMRKSICLQGVYVGSRRMFEDMNRFIASQEIVPVIDRHFPFDAARDAFHHLQTANHFGKLVVDL
ncbi:MAG: NAD(P)-dependent alcohol dehydrogenase [Gammaproteobacteria bacterium]|nr:NAD(P)-dependent alcohol dehydrogenase [Gammaproteobacteria bacterium]